MNRTRFQGGKLFDGDHAVVAGKTVIVEDGHECLRVTCFENEPHYH